MRARSGSRSLRRHAAIARIASHADGALVAATTAAGVTRDRALPWTVSRVAGSIPAMASGFRDLTKLS